MSDVPRAYFLPTALNPNLSTIRGCGIRWSLNPFPLSVAGLRHLLLMHRIKQKGQCPETVRHNGFLLAHSGGSYLPCPENTQAAHIEACMARNEDLLPTASEKRWPPGHCHVSARPPKQDPPAPVKLLDHSSPSGPPDGSHTRDLDPEPCQLSHSQIHGPQRL